MVFSDFYSTLFKKRDRSFLTFPAAKINSERFCAVSAITKIVKNCTTLLLQGFLCHETLK
jgi:hypothetical protein